jgi:lipid A ethanolaminephosphotransferase
MYLHATPYLVAPEAQKHIPMVAWFSPGWREHGGPALNCLKTQAGQRYSQDNLFHSVLGMMGVSTALYQRELDMFASCRQAS